MFRPPSTAAEAKRRGYLLLAAAVVLTAVFTAVALVDDNPWTRLVGVYLVTGLLAAAGLRALLAVRNGTVRVDERTQRFHYRAGYYAFTVLFLALGTDATFDLVDGTAHWLYLWLGLGTYLACLAYLRRTA